MWSGRSLHAKCIEAGVLLEDARVAAVLEAQFVAGEWFTRVP